MVPIFFDFNEPIFTNTIYHTIETPIAYSITDVFICANEMYNSTVYNADTTLSELVSTLFLDSFVITEINVLPVDSIEQFEFVPIGTQINNVEIIADTSIFELYTTTSGCDSILIRNFMIENPNSISLVDKSHWDIFPNPTSDLLSIRTIQVLSGDNSYTVRLYSILGTTVYEREHDIVPNRKLDLNLGDHAAGTYVLTISSKHGMISEKIAY